jgi:methyl-accepting chemotaxis protein
VDEAVLDELYSAPLDEFVARRNALAKELKAEGRADEAAEVAAARKPSVPLWAVNQLARRNKPAVDGLLGASDDLRKAIGKGDREAFGDAQRRQGDALRRLREAARSLLGGTTDATLERLVSTFRAASVDEELRELLAAGRLTEEPEPGGFDALAGLTFTPAKAKAAPKAKRDTDGRAERVKQATAELREAKATAREREREAVEAQRAAEKARKAADEAVETVRAAEEALEAARRR